MAALSCPERMSLLANLMEAMRRQCDLSDVNASSQEIALQMEISEPVRSAIRRTCEHQLRCPICRAHLLSERDAD